MSRRGSLPSNPQSARKDTPAFPPPHGPLCGLQLLRRQTGVALALLRGILAWQKENRLCSHPFVA